MYTRGYVSLLLESLGISRCYHGYGMAVEAVLCVLKDEDVLRNLRRHVFIPIALQIGSTWHCVERDVRTVVRRAWQINAAQLRQMAAYPLTAAPTVKEFIEIVAVYTLRNAPAEVLRELGQEEMCFV